jgi:hypothetical protein
MKSCYHGIFQLFIQRIEILGFCIKLLRTIKFRILADHLIHFSFVLDNEPGQKHPNPFPETVPDRVVHSFQASA